MEHRQRRVLRRALLACDVLVLALAVAVAFGLHALLRPVWPVLRSPASLGAYAGVAWSLLPIWLTLVLALRLDRTLERRSDWADTASRLLALHGLALVGLALVAFLTRSQINRSIVALLLGSSFVLMLLERRLLARLLHFQHESGHGRTRVLLAGAPGPELEALVARAQAEPFPPSLVGRVGPASGIESAPRLGGIEELERVLAEEAIDQVLFLPPYDKPEAAEAALAALEQQGVPAHFAVARPPGSAAIPRVSELYGGTFVSFEVSPREPIALALKHAFDLLAATALLLMLSPLLMAVALLVLATGGLPVLFVQERAGLHGRRFRMLKFRTMRRSAEAERDTLLARNETGGPAFKMRSDPRVTRLGSFLRKWSLDELPQLVNVLTGSMSLVGPRPLPVQEQAETRGWHRRRLSMKPGITGLWQVSGRNDLGFEEWMRLDLRYIDEWSLLLDIEILLRTLPAVLLARGAR